MTQCFKSEMKYCKDYCGVTCVNGNCPNIPREYDEQKHIRIHCSKCWYYKGCEDCYFRDNKEFPCPERKISQSDGA